MNTHCMKPSHQILIFEAVVGVEPRIEILQTGDKTQVNDIMISMLGGTLQLHNDNIESYLRGIEDIWQQEIEQSPQFMQIVLKGSSSEQQATS